MDARHGVSVNCDIGDCVCVLFLLLLFFTAKAANDFGF